MIVKGLNKRKTVQILILLCVVVLLSCANFIVDERIIEGSIFHATINDVTGDSYEIYLLSEDYKVYRGTWAGATNGDIVYTGRVDIYYRRTDDRKLKRYSMGDNELNINITKEDIYVINGIDNDCPDLLCVEVIEASNVLSLYSFYINNNDINAVEPIIGTYVSKDSSSEELIVIKYIGFFVEASDGKDWIKENYSLNISENKYTLTSIEYIDRVEVDGYLNVNENI